MPSPFRLFHFDIATENNFGDTLLFPAVKHVFEAFGAGEAFDVYDSRPLRENVGPALVRYINRTADAVLIGGGGLFLADTNPNRESGWQWRISLDMLEQLEVPLIVFAVGYNRFYGQPDFEAPFSDHLRKTIENSVFFGLRNHGSIDRVSAYVSEELGTRIEFQPCPTTLTRSILPVEDEQPDVKRIGIQLSTSRRYGGHGVGPDTVLEAAKEILPRLEDAGWDIVLTPFTKPDHRLSARLGELFDRYELIEVYGDDVLRRGVKDLSTVPFLLGCRGHAQMIPFGLGALPFSFDVHPKLGYFLSDIARPEWKLDPTEDTFATKMVDTIEEAWEKRHENRSDLANTQSEFLEITQNNLESIYVGLGGDPTSLSRRWVPYDVQSWNMARSRFLLEVQRENSIHRQHTFQEEARKTQDALAEAARDNHTAAEDRRILEASMRREQLIAGEALQNLDKLKAENRKLRELTKSQNAEKKATRRSRLRRTTDQPAVRPAGKGKTQS